MLQEHDGIMFVLPSPYPEPQMSLHQVIAVNFHTTRQLCSPFQQCTLRYLHGRDFQYTKRLFKNDPKHHHT